MSIQSRSIRCQIMGSAAARKQTLLRAMNPERKIEKNVQDSNQAQSGVDDLPTGLGIPSHAGK